jgi:hypothetical protein
MGELFMQITSALFVITLAQLFVGGNHPGGDRRTGATFSDGPAGFHAFTSADHIEKTRSP